MRLQRSTIAIPVAALMAAGLGCHIRLGVPRPPGEVTLTLALFLHELQWDPNNEANVVNHRPRHVNAAAVVWGQCNIAVRNFGIHPERGQRVLGFAEDSSRVPLGAKFVAHYPRFNEFVVRTENWRVLWNLAVRRTSSFSKGSDAHYTNEILLWNGSSYNYSFQPAGLTLQGDAYRDRQNTSVMRPIDRDNDQYALAHEIGHQLNLRHSPDNGNVMCSIGNCAGVNVTEGQCDYVRDFGALNHYFDGT